MEEIIAHPDFSTLISTFHDATFAVDGLEPIASAQSVGSVSLTAQGADSVRVDIVATWFDASLEASRSDGVLTVELNTVISERSSF